MSASGYRKKAPQSKQDDDMKKLATLLEELEIISEAESTLDAHSWQSCGLHLLKTCTSTTSTYVHLYLDGWSSAPAVVMHSTGPVAGVALAVCKKRCQTIFGYWSKFCVCNVSALLGGSFLCISKLQFCLHSCGPFSLMWSLDFSNSYGKGMYQEFSDVLCKIELIKCLFLRLVSHHCVTGVDVCN